MVNNTKLFHIFCDCIEWAKLVMYELIIKEFIQIIVIGFQVMSGNFVNFYLEFLLETFCTGLETTKFFS